MRRRPSIDHMLDVEIRIWRADVTDDSIGVEERQYTVAGAYDAFINRPATGEAREAAGLAPMGGIRWYGRPGIDVQVRDVCEVLSGSETGRTFEVNAPPVQPKLHHTQVDCIEWNGVLPPLE